MKMTRADLDVVLAGISLPRGWSLRTLPKGDGFLVQVIFEAPCATSGERREQRCRKWYVSPFSTTSEIVRTVYKAGQAALAHEFAEQFRFRGSAVYHPHRDLERAASRPDTFDRRDAAPITRTEWTCDRETR